MPNISMSHQQGTASPIPASPRNVSAFGWTKALSSAAPAGGGDRRALAATGGAEEPSVLGKHGLPSSRRALQGCRGCGKRGEQGSAR